MNITHITLTGAGSNTDLREMVHLSRFFPLVEWGLLYSPDRAGKENRYPDLQSLPSMAAGLQGAGCRTALHLCGRGVDQFVMGEATPQDDWIYSFDRVQLNLGAKHFQRFSQEHLTKAIERFGRPVITQQHPANDAMNRSVSAPNHVILFDASGGRGIEATEWPDHWESKASCGYAGGLSPENIHSHFSQIRRSAQGRPFWIDCEGRLRDVNDEFSLGTCESMLSKSMDAIYLAPNP